MFLSVTLHEIYLSFLVTIGNKKGGKSLEQIIFRAWQITVVFVFKAKTIPFAKKEGHLLPRQTTLI